MPRGGMATTGPWGGSDGLGVSPLARETGTPACSSPAALLVSGAVPEQHVRELLRRRAVSSREAPLRRLLRGPYASHALPNAFRQRVSAARGSAFSSGLVGSASRAWGIARHSIRSSSHITMEDFGLMNTPPPAWMKCRRSRRRYQSPLRRWTSPLVRSWSQF